MAVINRLSAAFALLALFGACFFVIPNLGGSGLAIPFNNWLWAFMGLAGGVLAAGQLWGGHVRLPMISKLAALAALITVLVAGVQWLADVPTFPMQAVMALLGLALLSFVFASWQERRLLQLLQLMALLAVGNGTVVALWFWATDVVDLRHPWLYGVLQQTNLFGSMGLLGLACSLALAPQHPAGHHPHNARFWRSLLNGLTLFVCVFAIYYSNSRTAFLGSAIIALCAIFSPAVRRASLGKKWIGIGLIALAVLVSQLMLNDSVQGGARRGTDQLLDAGGAHRIDIWQISLKLFSDAPLLGHGIGNFRGAFAHKQATTYAENGLYGVAHLHHPHNELMLWLTEGGLALTVPLLLLLAWLVRRWWRAKPFSASEWALLCAVGLHSLLEFPLHASALHLSAFALVLLLLEQRRYPLQSITLPKAEAGAALSLLLGAAATLFFATNIMTLWGLWGVIYGESDPLQRQKMLNDLPNQWAVQSNIEYAFYNNRLELAVKDADPILALSFVGWAESRIASTPDKNIMGELIKGYAIIGAFDAAEKIRQEIYFLFPPEVAQEVWPNDAENDESEIGGSEAEIENNSDESKAD